MFVQLFAKSKEHFLTLFFMEYPPPQNGKSVSRSSTDIFDLDEAAHKRDIKSFAAKTYFIN